LIHDALILGAGIHGLCAAFHLRRRGLRRVAVLERFAPGHDRGSSHGASRITRSSYHDPKFVALAAAAHRDGWPLLERELGARLVFRTPGLFFGPEGGPFGDYLRATLGSGADVERIDAAAARARFPLLAFDDGDAVLQDHTAGLLAAGLALRGLAEWCRRQDVELREGTRALALHAGLGAVRVDTDRGPVQAARVVVATGPWLAESGLAESGLAESGLGELVPGLCRTLRVLPQQIGYAEVPAAPAARAAGVFPVWARIGEQPDDFVYGLPEFGRPGLKIARHRTHGPGIGADDARPPIDGGALLQLAQQRFAPPVRRLLGSESCLYTVAPGEDFVVQRSAADPRVVVVAACSGHAFKFAPVLGQQVAELLGV
jgi:sarcosine oxidase